MKTNELLRRYVDDRSEPAFEKLVKQHIDLVYSSALRQVDGDVPAAQDVTQAVFTDLARKAPRLTQHSSLAGWLYTSTRFLAAKARRAEQCRRSHEQEALQMNQLLQPDSDPTWQELRPLLDDAMHDLSAADREAVLMRYFERLPLAEIGSRLGLKENTTRMRIERAMNRLRAALAKRGVTSTVTALSAVLGGRAVGCAPAELAAQVSRSAFAASAAGSGLGWGLLKLAGLMNGKLLMAASGVALVAGVVFVPQLLTRTKGDAPIRAVSSPTMQQTDPAGASSGQAIPDTLGVASARKPAESNVMVLRILARATGKPIAGATLVFWSQENSASNGPLANTEITADKSGVCEIPVSRRTVTLLGLGSRTDGYVDTGIAWQADHGETIPRQYTWRLDEATPIGGEIVDENGKPVAGADVTVWTSRNSASEDSSSPHVSTAATEHTISDAEGRWRIARFAQKAIPTLSFQVTHPDFVATELGFAFMNDPEVEQPLLAGAYVYKLHHGFSVSGIVVDTAGQPVSGVKVTAISGGRPRVTTNQSDGTFTLNGLKPGPSQINAEAHGFALTTTNVDLTANQEALRLELSAGNLLRLRVVNTNGTPVPNAAVSLNQAAGNSRFGGNGVAGLIRKQTGADGRMTWESAPDGPLFFSIQAFGYQRAQNVEVTADGEEHLLTLYANRTISGRVHDAALNHLITTFRVVMGVLESGSSAGGTNVQWYRSRTFRDGTFNFRENDLFGAVPRQYKFEADGYAPFVTRVVQPDEGDISFDVLLYQSAGTSITVLSPDGQPATNAFIGLDMPGARLDLKPGGCDGVGVLSVNDAGRFVLPPDDTITRVIAASPEGYAESTPTTLVALPSMSLQPWGQIEGTYLSGGKPAVGRALRLRQFDYNGFDRFRFFTAETDADGHFVFPRVPPGPAIPEGRLTGLPELP